VRLCVPRASRKRYMMLVCASAHGTLPCRTLGRLHEASARSQHPGASRRVRRDQLTCGSACASTDAFLVHDRSANPIRYMSLVLVGTASRTSVRSGACRAQENPVWIAPSVRYPVPRPASMTPYSRPASPSGNSSSAPGCTTSICDRLCIREVDGSLEPLSPR